VEIASVSEGVLAGMSFCFTGTLNTMSRSSAEDIVRENGGTAKSSVTKDLTHLVTNNPESGSGKAKKARDLGIPILSESDFLALLQAD